MNNLPPVYPTNPRPRPFKENSFQCINSKLHSLVAFSNGIVYISGSVPKLIKILNPRLKLTFLLGVLWSIHPHILGQERHQHPLLLQQRHLLVAESCQFNPGNKYRMLISWN